MASGNDGLSSGYINEFNTKLDYCLKQLGVHRVCLAFSSPCC